MDISAFNEFVELAKRLNITETARMLNMSQPTLSKHIISFEKELRLSLFERTGSAMRLTEAGNALPPLHTRSSMRRACSTRRHAA